VNELPWRPIVYLPVNLTVRFGRDVLNADDVRPWCAQKAATLLGQDAGRRQIKRLTYCLEEYAKDFKANMPLVAAAIFFYPDFAHLPPRANTQVEAFDEDPQKGPLTMAIMREMLEQPDELSYGNVELTETEVTAGRALRAHRFRKAQPQKRHSRIGEEIIWIVWPPESTAVVSMATRWLEPAFSEAGIIIADEMADNFRIKPKQ
jgi:hypothetical protein